MSVPGSGCAGQVSGQRTIVDGSPRGRESSRRGCARSAAEVCSVSVSRPNDTRACAKQKSGSRSAAAPAGDGAIGRRRAHAVAPGQLAGRHRRPHRPGLRRPQRRQVHRRAAVEQAPEVRQPAVGDGRRDEVERRGVHRKQHDAARAGVGRKHRRCLEAPRARAWTNRPCRAPPAAGRARPAPPARTPPAASRLGRVGPQPEHAEHDARDRTRRHGHRGHEEAPRRVRIERGAETPEVLPHQGGGGRRRGGAEPRQHAIAEPPRRHALGRQHLARDDDGVEDDGQVDAVDEQHGAQQRPGRRVVQSDGGVQMQHERGDVGRGDGPGQHRVREHPEEAHSGILPAARAACRVHGASSGASCRVPCAQCGVPRAVRRAGHPAPGTAHPALRHRTKHTAPGTRHLLYFPRALRRRRAGDREPPSFLRLQRAQPRGARYRGGHRARSVRDGQARSQHRSAAAAAVFGVRDSPGRRRARSASRSSASASA